MSPMTFQHSQPTVTTMMLFADPVAPLAAGRLGGACSRISSQAEVRRKANQWSFDGHANVELDRTSHTPSQSEGDSNEATNRRGKHPS